MSTVKQQKSVSYGRLIHASVAVVLLLVFLLYARGTVDVVYKRMQAELLRSVNLASHVVSPREIALLKGSREDLDSPLYHCIKNRLRAIKETNESYSWVYLLGMDEDGRVFFFVDDAEIGHEDESPPGMIYEESPPEFIDSLVSGVATVTEPFRDKWGEFVSAAVPLIDPETGGIKAVFVVVHDASSWREELFSRSRIPILSLGLFMLIAFIAYFVTRPMDVDRVSLAKRILFPFIVLAMAVAGIFVSITGSLMLLFLALASVAFVFWQFDKNHLSVELESAMGKRLLAATFDSVGEGVIIFDKQGKALALNRIAGSLTGHAISEAEGRGSEELFRITCFQEDETNTNPVSLVLDGHNHVPVSSEGCLQTSDGSKRPIEYNCSAIWDAKKKLLGCVLVFRDITEKLEAARKLEENNRNLQDITRSLKDVVWLCAADDRSILYVSPSYEILFGKSPDELRNDPAAFLRGIHSDDVEAVAREYDGYIQGGEFDLDYRIIQANGDVKWIHTRISPVYDEEGTVRRHVGIATEVSERKSSETRLRAGMEYVQSVVNNMPDTLLVLNKQGVVIDCNHEAENSLVPGEYVLGRRLRDLVPAATSVLLDEAMERLFRSRDPVEFECSDYDQSVVRYFSIRIALLGEESAICLLRDITVQKSVERALLESNDRLQAAIDAANEMASRAEMASLAKGEFLANMSHEIRTPMNGVIGMTGLLLDTDLDDDQQKYASIVKHSAESLLGVVNDILDFSKIEAGKIQMEILDFDLETLLDDFSSTLAISAAEKKIDFLWALDPDVPIHLRGDPGRLRQILTNLGGNAIKFTRTGEVLVRVSLARTYRERIKFDPENTEVELRFSIRDTGIGIPKDKIGTLFQKFSQVDTTSTREFGGTGLGLAIAKQLVGLMDGEIGVESEYGVGSEFWFTAKLGLREESAVYPSAIEPANLDNIRVLIVDDNQASREVLGIHTRAWGMRPTEACDGEEALILLKQAKQEDDPFDLALIDMQMPRMDGRELGKTIFADKDLADTKAVMITSFGLRGDARSYENMGFCAYLTKPLRYQELRAVLSLVLSNSVSDSGAGKSRIITRHSAREMLGLFKCDGARVLIVEDNITNQQVAKSMLDRLGLKSDTVANGLEAIRALEDISYDLVLMDVQMPEMDGLEATAKIRSSDSRVQNRKVAIVAMTAYASAGDREKCLMAGMDDFVSKPVSVEAICDILEKWLPSGCRESLQNQEGNTSELPSQDTEMAQETSVFAYDLVMDRLMNDEVLVRTVIVGYLEDIPRQIEKLKEYLTNNDAGSAERQAHNIKGASASVGAEMVFSITQDMENKARRGELSLVNELMSKLDEAFVAYSEAVEARLAG